MLVNLHVKNLGLIDEIEVDFAGNLNVLTGETGAGKSIIIESIAMGLGGKMPKEMLRKNADFGLVELIFSVENSAARKNLENLGVSFADGKELIISRKLTGTRTVNRINGESVTAAALKEAAAFLLAIHGQTEQQTLLGEKKQLEIVDRFAGERIAADLAKLKESHRQVLALTRELDGMQVPEADRIREISFLEYQIGEIEAAALKPGEEKELAARFQVLSHAQQIAQGLSQVYAATGGDAGTASESVGQALRTLSRLTEFDERLVPLEQDLSRVEEELADFSREVSAYLDTLTVDEEELLQMEKRLDTIRGIKAKYGQSVEAVEKSADAMREKLEKYRAHEEVVAALTAKLNKEKENLKNLAEAVSRERKNCAKKLSEKISAALLDLNFLQVRFAIDVQKLTEITALGQDRVVFLIAVNPGEDMRPVADVASGGELSRIMLAVEEVLAATDDVATMIFDEIDAGISGRTAQKVAEKLAGIGATHQVICISHLAQIAAMADSHFLIEKVSERDHTRTSIRPLSEEGRTEELARILGGAKVTEAVTDSAREMRQLATEWKGSAHGGS